MAAHMKEPTLDRPLALAYVGDAVWELYVRRYLLSQGFLKPGAWQKQAVRYVSAKAQAFILQQLGPVLTETERDVVRRGRNVKSKSVPKHSTVLEYRHSTAFEALIGYLYETNQKARLAQLVEQAFKVNETKEGHGE